MMGLKWAMSYKFDEEADSYVLTTPDEEEIEEEQSQLGGQVMFPTNGRFSDDDLDDSDDDPSE
jgi:hypothetical protein